MAQLIEMLMVEDNPGDVELAREALAGGKFRNNLHVVNDGEKALDFIYQRGEFTAVPRPDLILLDLNLPKLSGRDVLGNVKANPHFSSIPIIVLSGSEDARDIQESYGLSANSFVTKPVSIREFLQVVQAIEHFWVEIVQLPSGKN